MSGMVLAGSDFSPVRIEDRALFQEVYEQFPQVHSDNTFANMICWNSYAHYRYARVRDSLLISSTIGGKTKFRPPVGPPDTELFADLLSLCMREGDESPLVLITDSMRLWIEEEYPEIPLHPDRNYWEYVYLADDLAHLPGKNYLTIRRHLSKFRRNCNPVVEPIDGSTRDEVREFLVEWCEWKSCDGEPFLVHEKDAVMHAVTHMEEIGLSGLLIRVVGRVGAISLFEPLNRETLVVHFEKGLPDCEGIYKAINAETAYSARDRFPFINRESDMGVPGLREAKMRYHPHHMVEVWYAARDDLERLV
jgi:hypothetical protein